MSATVDPADLAPDLAELLRHFGHIAGAVRHFSGHEGGAKDLDSAERWMSDLIELMEDLGDAIARRNPKVIVTVCDKLIELTEGVLRRPESAAELERGDVFPNLALAPITSIRGKALAALSGERA